MNNSGEAVGKLMRYYKAGGPRAGQAYELHTAAQARLLSPSALVSVSPALHAQLAAETMQLLRHHKAGGPTADKAHAW